MNSSEYIRKSVQRHRSDINSDGHYCESLSCIDERNGSWKTILDSHIDYSYAYRQAFNISSTFVANKFVDHSEVVGASPLGAAPTTSSFSTQHMASMDWAKITARREDNHLSFGV